MNLNYNPWKIKFPSSSSTSLSLSLSIVNMSFWVYNYFVFDCFDVVVVFVFARGLDEKKYIVLIPLPSLIINKKNRSFVLSLSPSTTSLLLISGLAFSWEPSSPPFSWSCLAWTRLLWAFVDCWCCSLCIETIHCRGFPPGLQAYQWGLLFLLPGSTRSSLSCVKLHKPIASKHGE